MFYLSFHEVQEYPFMADFLSELSLMIHSVTHSSPAHGSHGVLNLMRLL